MERSMWTTTNQPQPWLLARTAAAGNLTRLDKLASQFAPISLEEMDDVALLNRIDTKFVMTAAQLVSVLSNLSDTYWMLEVDGRRRSRYRTLYFDTPRFDLYHAHVNDRAERYKVRSREYTDSHLSFLEVKRHTRKNRTIKERLSTTYPVVQMTGEQGGWLETVSPLDYGTLEPKLWNTFTRMTLVSMQFCERVTIDMDLTFNTGERSVKLDGIVVAEVKRDAAGCASPFLSQMRLQHIRPLGFSKYAIGTALLYEQVKKNRLKPKMLRIEKLMKGMVLYE